MFVAKLFYFILLFNSHLNDNKSEFWFCSLLSDAFIVRTIIESDQLLIDGYRMRLQENEWKKICGKKMIEKRLKRILNSNSFSLLLFLLLFHFHHHFNVSQKKQMEKSTYYRAFRKIISCSQNEWNRSCGTHKNKNAEEISNLLPERKWIFRNFARITFLLLAFLIQTLSWQLFSL